MLTPEKKKTLILKTAKNRCLQLQVQHLRNNVGLGRRKEYKLLYQIITPKTVWRSRLFSKYTFLPLILSIILKTLSFSPNLKASSKEWLGFRHKIGLEEKSQFSKDLHKTK